MNNAIVTRAVLAFVAVLAFAISPLLFANFSGWEPSRFPVEIARHPIQPAGYAFSIWGLIYLALVVHGAFGLFARRESAEWDAVRLPLIIAAAIGFVWMPIANASPLWGTLTIWPMAAAALSAFVLADTGQDRWLLSGPLAIFAGWMSAAACVSTGVFLGGYGVLAPSTAAWLMVAVMLVIAISVQRFKPAQPLYGLTVIWALVGVVVANWADTMNVVLGASLGILLMAATVVMALRGR
ncbi:hypothetical protein Q9295_09540 [Xinfangfangia sp. CPCC 101601]|uniref:Seryl-tRNA synthetase n=1 Tax=Pseudogemmobacter lacusdianii TaxID=3069608 RepID=A0ABU0VY06_9RHOB|nr:hypothetical protein [Xinfangfangia sp. CPCC 101601]MDQ2066617.1 hypothetical protein [Xinfangfangia sp. CPCC 101601]